MAGLRRRAGFLRRGLSRSGVVRLEERTRGIYPLLALLLGSKRIALLREQLTGRGYHPTCVPLAIPRALLDLVAPLQVVKQGKKDKAD